MRIQAPFEGGLLAGPSLYIYPLLSPQKKAGPDGDTESGKSRGNGI